MNRNLANSEGLLFLITIGLESLDPLRAVLGAMGASSIALNLAESRSKKKECTRNNTLSTYVSTGLEDEAVA